MLYNWKQSPLKKNKGNLSLQPLTKIDEMYSKLKGAKYFMPLDLRSWYYHITLAPEARAKTAFVTPFGKYEFNKVPFGLAQAPAYFQELIHKVIGNVPYAMGYLDDIIIFIKTEEEHLQHIADIFEKLHKAGLKLKLSKCSFLQKELQYLGHLVSEEGVQPLPEKLESIQNMPAPRNAKEVKQFLGLVSYYQKFIPRFSDIACPLSKLMAKDQVFKWTELCQAAFEMLKDKLYHEPILKYPDTSKPYTLFTDASNYSWAGVLTQEYKSVDTKGNKCTTLHPVAYVSGLFRGSQLNWSVLTKEAYTIYMCIKRLTFYISGMKVTTSH